MHFTFKIWNRYLHTYTFYINFQKKTTKFSSYFTTKPKALYVVIAKENIFIKAQLYFKHILV